VIGKVKNGKIIVSILSISECTQKIKLNDLNKIFYDESSDYNLFNIDTIKINDSSTRIKQIKNLIRSEHMNIE
jgi:hypothetical protein